MISPPGASQAGPERMVAASKAKAHSPVTRLGTNVKVIQTSLTL
jgi:hypothetical protein